MKGVVEQGQEEIYLAQLVYPSRDHLTFLGYQTWNFWRVIKDTVWGYNTQEGTKQKDLMETGP